VVPIFLNDVFDLIKYS